MNSIHFAAAGAALLALCSCGDGADAPAPGEVENFLTELNASEQANRVDAVAEARARETERRQAAEKRLERFEQGKGAAAEADDPNAPGKR